MGQDGFMTERTGGARRSTRRINKKPLAAVVIAGLAITGCSAGPAAGGSSPSPATGTATGSAGPHSALSWQACPRVAQNLLCSSLKVPLNYAQPHGRQITLALSEVPATAPPGKRQGVLLVNPGGPGGPGRSLAEVVAQGLRPEVAAEYDIIGFDTRGTGASVPALTCDPSFYARARPNYVPATHAAEQALIARARTYAADCQKRFGWLLPYMTTRNIARDLDSIRVALGQRQISYYAFSYGTYIGQVYATMFPSRVRRMVLDSIVNPDGVWYADNFSQDYAFQGRQTAFLRWAARYNSQLRLGSTPAAVSRSYAAAQARLLAHPIDGLVGADELNDTFLAGGYDDAYWPALATALSDYLRGGNGGQLLRLYRLAGVQPENEFAVYNAVECGDVAWPRDWATWDAETRKVSARAPFEAWGNTWFNAACAFWPVHGPARPMKIGAPGLPGILMLQGTLDPATPYAGALSARRALPTARMVVVKGGGNHGQSLAQPPNTCVNGYLNRYLATGALPSGSGLVSATCPAVPAPAP
jgi:pimeloyl-ACP methyl ester carboxylesterase